jgi:hypothetical protein
MLCAVFWLEQVLCSVLLAFDIRFPIGDILPIGDSLGFLQKLRIFPFTVSLIEDIGLQS